MRQHFRPSRNRCQSLENAQPEPTADLVRRRRRQRYALAPVGAPWWLTALVFACFTLGLVVTGIQSVFPQDSEHRLAWWRARWNHQQRRQNILPTGRRAVRRTGAAAGSRPEPPSHNE
ncbi:hypothetical protein [Streptomyces sp. NPDC059916]|uniref:hypothetical protein n=1 Tax=Streptomyces sp. NPDC059916 TaxID=3347001 RepID=UPI003690F868